MEEKIATVLACDVGNTTIRLALVEADGFRMLPIKAPADHEPVIPDETNTTA